MRSQESIFPLDYGSSMICLWERCSPQLPQKSTLASYCLIMKLSGETLFHLYVPFMNWIFNMKAKKKIKNEKKAKLYNAIQLMIPCRFVTWQFTWTRLFWALRMAFWYCIWLQVKIYSSVPSLLFHAVAIWQPDTLLRVGTLNRVLGVKATSVWVDKVSRENVLISIL